MARTLLLLVLSLFLVGGTASAESIRDRKNNDDEELAVDRYFEEPSFSSPRHLLLTGGLQTYYQRYWMFFPSFNLEVSLGSYFALGVFANFYTTSDTGYSFIAAEALITGNVYPIGKFDGLWFRLGAGALGTQVTTTSTKTNYSPTVVALGGWRFLIQDPQVLFSLGLSVGGQFYFGTNKTGSVPTALVEIGAFL